MFKKPMLLSNEDFDLREADYTNMFESKKRDGVRAEVENTGLKGRSFKKFANVKLAEYFQEVCDKIPPGMVLEAEIYCPGVPCREMAGICRSLDREVPEYTELFIFGMYHEDKTFEERWEYLKTIFGSVLSNTHRIHLVQQNRINSYEEVETRYNQYLDDGFEGMVLMDGRKKYKCNRVTIREHIGFKLKPGKETDLPIIGVTERLLNTNESQTNELGHSFKRNTVDAKENTGIAGTFICKLPNGMEQGVTITGDEAFRREIWKNKEDYIGQYAVVKSMAYGEKDRLRHPRLKDIKHSIEK